MTFGPFLFAAPWALAALASLPILFWLLRATPPPPQRTAFPPTRLLLGLKTEEQSRERAPLWLVLLRALAAALIIIGFARPSLAPTPAEIAAGGGRTLIVIDDGWTSAPFWPDVRNAAVAAAAEAERANAPVFLLTTAPSNPPRDAGEALVGADARGRINRLEPQPWRPDRADAAERLARVEGRFAKIVWITDGLDDAGSRAFAELLQSRGPVTARMPARTARAIVSAAVTPQGIETQVRRASNGGTEGAVAAETLEGRSLGAAALRFTGDGASARIELPPEIAARAARVRIVGEAHAGALRLLPGGVGRPFVGLIDPGGEGQPLLSELYYAERALQPYASLQRGTVSARITARAQALILPDAASVSPRERTELNRWIERGGLLVRFAGPRLADEADDLLPVRLRPGSRALGSALAWEKPLGLAQFPADSPFAGIATPGDVQVRRQVLAEPASAEAARVWARLSDNSPLVTAAPKGDGLIVLYHVGAGPEWSDLPLSGLFVEMLRRTLAFASRSGGAGEREIAAGPYTPVRLMDGFGTLAPAPATAEPVTPEAFALAVAGPETPPGLYERAGIAGAIDAARADELLAPLALPNGINRTGLGARIEQPLAGWFLGLGALILAIDLMIALLLVGRLPRFVKTGAGAALALIAFGLQDQASAQDNRYAYGPPERARVSNDPTISLRLAYVRTGDSRLDRVSQQGLEELSTVLRNRTAVQPGDPIGVDLETADLSTLPFLYWPAPASPQRLSDNAIANLDRYLTLGGMLLIDTRDAGARDGARPAASMLQGIDTPPLEQVAADHVVTRSFYLLRGFPGASVSTRLWAESASAASSRDGVAAIFIGDGDWATAWAGARPLNGGNRQRELALRFGVNLVMVALTGNYKADQVHVPALLERLGRERRDDRR